MKLIIVLYYLIIGLAKAITFNLPQPEPDVVPHIDPPVYHDQGILTPAGGVCYYNGHKETYYNLDMSYVVETAHNNGIDGEYWVREDGCKMLGEYIIVAAAYSVHPYGSLVETSLGTGIVVDTGAFAKDNVWQLDLAVTW